MSTSSTDLSAANTTNESSSIMNHLNNSCFLSDISDSDDTAATQINKKVSEANIATSASNAPSSLRRSSTQYHELTSTPKSIDRDHHEPYHQQQNRSRSHLTSKLYNDVVNNEFSTSGENDVEYVEFSMTQGIAINNPHNNSRRTIGTLEYLNKQSPTEDADGDEDEDDDDDEDDDEDNDNNSDNHNDDDGTSNCATNGTDDVTQNTQKNLSSFPF